MSLLDWIIIGAYMAGMIGLSVFLGRGQENKDDYYVGGRNLPWWAVGISTMATQTSAISFISIPAFVALRPGGGLTWLQYELAVPLAMIFVMVLFIPFFRRLELISVYEYLELRFDRRVRYFLSAVFLLSRGLGTGVGVYASAIVLSVCLDVPLWSTILMIGVVTVIYDTIGGMTAVVYSDVVQMVVLLGGLLLCVGFASSEVGGLSAALFALPAERWIGVGQGHGLGDGAKAPFWGFLVGGFFLYASYYGVDQSQAQRELAAPTLKDTKRSLVFNGLARFPLTMLYLLLGVTVGAAYLESPELRAAVPAEHLDYLIPQFILTYLPSGVRAVLFAAILAAAMSSLDSALNSLSAATMQDFLDRDGKLGAGKTLLYGKITTVIWGAVITGMAFLVGNISKTVVEGINKIGSAFYGPILAAFLLGVASKRANATGVLTGIVTGVAANLLLWVLADTTVHFMWWNFIGCVVAVLVGLAVSAMTLPPDPDKARSYTLSRASLAEERSWLPTYGVLVAYFGVIVLCVFLVEKLGT